MDRAKVYRNIDRPQEWFGVELFDAFVLAALMALLMELYPHHFGWDLLIMVLAWGALRFYKRGKPKGHLQSLVRFYFMRPEFLSAGARDRTWRPHPQRRSPRPAAPASVQP